MSAEIHLEQTGEYRVLAGSQTLGVELYADDGQIGVFYCLDYSVGAVGRCDEAGRGTMYRLVVRAVDRRMGDAQYVGQARLRFDDNVVHAAPLGIGAVVLDVAEGHLGRQVLPQAAAEAGIDDLYAATYAQDGFPLLSCLAQQCHLEGVSPFVDGTNLGQRTLAVVRRIDIIFAAW